MNTTQMLTRLFPKTKNISEVVEILEKYKNYWENKKMIKKSIEFNLIPDENKEYNVKMFHNETQVREENIDSQTMKHYLSGKFSDKELNQARLMIKMFKSKKIKLHLKE